MKYEYPAELPVSAARDEIASAVKRSQVVIVSGQTGSGKTTQLPKILLELGRGTHGKQIVHTQPRRIAARTVAERIASEMGVKLGDEVGYQVRFTDESSPGTRLTVFCSPRSSAIRNSPDTIRSSSTRRMSAVLTSTFCSAI